MWPSANETAYCWGLWLGAGVLSIFFVWPGPGTERRPAPDTIAHTVRERERERERGMSGRVDEEG